jgi:hypothetical protein
MNPESPFDQEMEPETIVPADITETPEDSVKQLDSIDDFKANLAKLTPQDLQLILKSMTSVIKQ